MSSFPWRGSGFIYILYEGCANYELRIDILSLKTCSLYGWIKQADVVKVFCPPRDGGTSASLWYILVKQSGTLRKEPQRQNLLFWNLTHMKQRALCNTTVISGKIVIKQFSTVGHKSSTECVCLNQPMVPLLTPNSLSVKVIYSREVNCRQIVWSIQYVFETGTRRQNTTRHPTVDKDIILMPLEKNTQS